MGAIELDGKQDPVTLVKYAQEHDILNMLGWKFLCSTARQQCFINVIFHAATRCVARNQVRYKFGVQAPQTYKEVLSMDKENGNTLWQEAVRWELDHIMSYKCFRCIGIGVSHGPEYKKIQVRLVFGVKAEWRLKECLVARGDMMPEPEESVYLSVATLWSLHILIFLAELNGLLMMQRDISNVYLESYTQEKVYFIAGPEFGQYAGQSCIIKKALYGLRSSG